MIKSIITEKKKTCNFPLLTMDHVGRVAILHNEHSGTILSPEKLSGYKDNLDISEFTGIAIKFTLKSSDFSEGFPCLKQRNEVIVYFAEEEHCVILNGICIGERVSLNSSDCEPFEGEITLSNYEL